MNRPSPSDSDPPCHPTPQKQIPIRCLLLLIATVALLTLTGKHGAAVGGWFLGNTTPAAPPVRARPSPAQTNAFPSLPEAAPPGALLTEEAAAQLPASATPEIRTFSSEPSLSVAPVVPKAYVKRTRPTQLNVAALPDRAASPGRTDRLALFADTAPTVRWEKLSDHGSRNYAWFGSLVEDRISAVTLTRVGDYTILDVRSPKFGDYEVHGQDGKVAEVREFDSNKINKGCKESVLTAGFGTNSNGEVSFEVASNSTAAAAFTGDPKTIDVLVVYTTKAMTDAGGRSAIVARAQSGVNGLNGAFGHSLIVHEVRLVQTRETTHTASSSLPTELNWVAGNSTIASIRSEVSADLVGFMSDKDSGGVGGIAQLPGAFSAVYSDLFGGVWPHEAGHNFGCQHNSPGIYPYASGHYWTDSSDGVQRGSIMSYIGSRIPYFSNPDKEFSGEPTGTSTRNNALCVNNRGDDTAAFKSGSKVIVEPNCTVTSSKTNPNVGVDFTVSIKTTNGGPSPATATKLAVTLPSRLTLVSHNGGAGFDTTTNIWSVPSLADNASATLVLTLRPNANSLGVSQTVGASVSSVGSGVVDFDIYNNSGSASVVPVPVPVSGLVLHYPLDETSGKTATDSSDHDALFQNATTTYAAPLWQPTGGMIGGALKFTHSAQADVAQAFSYNAATPIVTAYPYTMALWLRATPGTWYQVCAMLGDATLGSSYSEISMNNSRAQAMVRNTSNSGVSAVSPTSLAVADDAWHHVAAVFTSSTLRTLYVDGVAVATNTASVPFVANAKRFSIGALMRDNPTQSFPGYLDDIGLWNTALTKEHIAIIHALGRYSRVGLDDSAIATLAEGGLAPGTTATAGGLVWEPTTGLTGTVGTTGLQGGQPYLVLNTNGGGLIGSPPDGGEGVNSWFDQNSTTAGFGVTKGSSYDWTAGSVWGANNAGTGALIAWPGGSNAAFFAGAGDGTSYTVRLGATGATNVVLQNFFLNSDGAATAVANGSGNVTIGNIADTGALQLNAGNSFGSASGTLTINNPVNLGPNRNANFRGGAVTINGVVSGTGTSGVVLESGGGFIGALAAGTLTLANPDNTYTGANTINADYVLSVPKLADGGLSSSIGASSNAAANLVLNGGTLRYTGATAATNRNFTLAPNSSSEIAVSAAGTVLTISGASAVTSGTLSKTGAGTLALSGANLHDGLTIISEGTLSVGASAHLGDGNELLLDGGVLQVTGTTLTSFAGHETTFTTDKSVSLDIANAANIFTIGQALDQGNGGLNKSGAGTLTLSGVNTYTGPTMVSAGVLSVASAEGLGSTSFVTVAGPARLNFSQPSVQGPADPTVFKTPIILTDSTLRFNAPGNRSNYTISGLITLKGTGLSSIASFNAGTNYINLTGGITGTGGLEIQAGGANAGHAHVFSLSGTLDYAGATQFETNAAKGRVVLGSTSLPSGTVLSLGAQVNVGTNLMQFDLNGNNQTLAGLQTFVYNGGGTGINQVINSSVTAASLTINNSTDYTFSGNLGANGQTPIAGAAGTGNNFGLIKAGTGMLTLTGINTYTGDTTVNAGVLAVTGSSIADTNKLVITSGKVQPTGTEIVNTLFFGAAQQASGTWGASGSGAANSDDVHFSGSGLVNVMAGPPTNFGSWAAGFGLAVQDQGPNDDPDGDGLNNLLEYVLSSNPAANDATAIAPRVTLSGSNVIFTFRRSHTSESDTTLSVEFGSDMVHWGSYSIGPFPGVPPVSIQKDTPDSSSDTVTVTIPTGGSSNFFSRLKAVK